MWKKILSKGSFIKQFSTIKFKFILRDGSKKDVEGEKG
jgi:hypothetical protein